MNNTLSTSISTSSLKFCPGEAPAAFWVAVQNNSSDYASFQFDLTAAGEEKQTASNWYRLVSADAYTLPPNDCIKFEVEILSLPPGREGFVGSLFLQATISSSELAAHAYQTLKLVVTGVVPELAFATDQLQGMPGEEVAIALDVKNSNDQPMAIDLRLTEPVSPWLNQTQKTVLLDPKATTSVEFLCQVPSAPDAPQGCYPFSAEVLQSGEVTTSQLTQLEILHGGQVERGCEAPHQQCPAEPGRWLTRHRKPATYTLTTANRSNANIQSEMTIREKISPGFWRRILPRQTKIINIEQVPVGVHLPLGSESRSQINIEYRPPWVGWGSYQEFQILDRLLEPAIEVNDKTPILSLKLLPVLPRWFQGLGIVGLMLFIWSLFSLGHQETVKHVEFPHQISQGVSNVQRPSVYNVVSGAENGALLAWPLRSHLLWLVGQHFNLFKPLEHKAIEVVRYRPDNQQVAVGYKNGEIDIYDWPLKETRYSLSIKDADEKPCQTQERGLGGAQFYTGDRVYDLAFSSDGQVLYSAHGSGRVLKWKLNNNGGDPECLQSSHIQGYQNNTVTAISLVEKDGASYLAIAGQRNHLHLINLEDPSTRQRLLPLKQNPNPVSHDDHIRTLASPTNTPSLLAAGDDHGRIILLDLETCTDDLNSCETVDVWQGHEVSAVRAISFSDDGCYLASAGDDGRVKLWPMTTAAGSPTRLNRFSSQGYVLRTSRRLWSLRPFQPKPIETVDLVRSTTGQDTLFIVSGGEDRQVRLQVKAISQLNKPLANTACPSS